MALVLAAQEKPAQEKPAEAKPAEAGPTQPKAVEQPVRGEFEIGVRFNSDVRGDLNTYRSIVNLGEGVRLLRWDTWLDAKKKWLKQAHFYGGGWGGDPSAWLRLSAEDGKWYRFNADHRTTAYFNALPSFANPLLERGILANQRSYDTRRRFTEFEVALLPASPLIPYFSYTRDRGFGRGVTNFVADANEYPVLNNLNDRTNVYRGGVRVERRRLHLTLEQGGIQFRDDQNTEAGPAAQPGNRTAPIFGEQLVLRDLRQAYGIEGSSVFSRGLVTAQPAGWLDINGAFQFSQPRNDITYTQTAAGRFIDLDSLLFLNTQNARLLGAAKQPHLTANLGLEIRPEGRLRVLQSWTTDRLHNASSVSETPFSDRLEWNYNQQQTEVLVEPVARLTLRGGYRYVWGDGRARASFLGNAPFERGELRRHGALMGAGYRMTDRFSLYSDVEIVRSDRVLFRTSLTDYEKVRVRGRHALTGSLRLYGSLQYLNNETPPELNRFEFRSMQEAMGLEWMPGSGQGVQVIGEYARSTIRSDLLYLAPQTLGSERSFYRENAHTVTGLVTVPLALGWTWQARLSAGGSMFVSSGSRPTDFYQPVARVTLPLGKRCSVLAEYRWYGVSQTFYTFEGFRSHQGIIGLRIN
ncbi:MAG: hypothetical protein SFV51_00305 [Bryobacteraceae bacterium]|nr:hypothetical protein [Bryobacteraceae bacterium]